MTDEYPEQPPLAEWKFVEMLKSPLHTKLNWRRLKNKPKEINLGSGVSLQFGFPDPAGKLTTIYDDFKLFLQAGAIAANGAYKIITRLAPTSTFEEYIIDADKNSCQVLAGDTEGIRRALVFLEDRILSTGGPFLPLGKIQRKPFIKTRVSRCFFGPINRPPMNRDELMDDIDYYPDEYLNRLVHEGVNGLWLSIAFMDFCPSRFFPDHGKDAQKRVEKLRQTVKQCARFGIKIYLYCNEPSGFGPAAGILPPSALEKNPWFAGHSVGEGWTFFCTSSPEGLEYVETCTNFIFSNVPELGGLICITHGERPTSCYSNTHSFFNNNCPRCSKRKPWEVYHDQLAAMARGIKRAAPDAEFISWLYGPGFMDNDFSSAEEKMEVIRKIAAHTPQEVVTQLNFETNGKVKQLGRELTAYDYWLSWPGPSGIFSDCAAIARKAGARTSAKIQVGCAWENASIPFMPVPGSLYRKYRAMKKLGVSSVMQCWYFGNYPGLMNKAAGELSFLPFAKTETAFLGNLAKMDWADNYQKVSQAWKLFFKGFSHFPVSLSFTWFGPLHCSIVWPLYLFPVDQPIIPSWELDHPDSGDRIGECIGFDHSLAEVLMLLAKMDRYWRQGLAILTGMEKDYANNHDRQLDIILCRAIGLQISSAKNIFNFYDLREKLPFLRKKGQLAALAKMQDLVNSELENCEKMKQLCRHDPRLGFHSEAEGYNFFPAKLDWRAGLLKQLLAVDFPQVSSDIENGRPLFAAYTGAAPEGKSYRCGKNQKTAVFEKFDDGVGSWRAWTEKNKLCFEVKWLKKSQEGEQITIDIEPRRLWQLTGFTLSAAGKKSFYCPPASRKFAWSGGVKKSGEFVISTFAIPFKTIPWYEATKPLRINVYQSDSPYNANIVGRRPNQYLGGWIKKHPLKPRLIFGPDNSADLGWLFPAPRDS